MFALPIPNDPLGMKKPATIRPTKRRNLKPQYLELEKKYKQFNRNKE